MPRARTIALACLALALIPAAAAQAKVRHERRPARVEVGKVRLGRIEHGRRVLLVPVRYPIQLAHQPLEIAVSLAPPGGGTARTWALRVRGNAGPPRSPERRRAFTFVHRIDLSPRLTHLVDARGRRPLVRVKASGELDLNHDGFPELDSSDSSRQRLPRATAGAGSCATVPEARARPGRPVTVELPACGARMRWRLGRGPAHGAAHIDGERLTYRSASRFRGIESIRLVGRRAGRGGGRPRGGNPRGSERSRLPAHASGSASAAAASAAAASEGVTAPIQIAVTPASGVVVRAIGDSVTAGFGYYDDGTLMPFEDLLECKPPETAYDDACSSNSAVRSNSAKQVEYAPDYGLANDVSWAAQWATSHGVTDYENLAVSGSEPKDWAPGGQFYATTKRVEEEDPDYILMTVGANPLLSDLLFGVDNMGCAVWSDIVGGFSECIEGAFEEIGLRANLERLYRELATKTSATIYLMEYPLSVPSSALAYSAEQIAEAGALLNREIVAVAGAVNGKRLRPIAPPHFNVGISVESVYPSEYTCSIFGFKVDGQSVQSTPTQRELEGLHYPSFCKGPKEGQPWVISGDTGIHPSAAGYAQMAAQVPAPVAAP